MSTVPDTVPESIETVATFVRDGRAHEIDHLGIYRDSQWGQLAIYCDGEQVGEFAIEESFLKREYQPTELPVSKAELIRLANEALSET